MSVTNWDISMNRNLSRLVVGFVLAPIAPGILFALLSILLGERELAAWYIQLAALIGYPLAIVIGVPAHLLFRHRGWRGGFAYFGVGLAMGICGYFLPFVPGYLSGGSGASYAIATTLLFLPVSMGCGGLAAVVFWLIAIWNQQGASNRQS